MLLPLLRRGDSAGKAIPIPMHYRPALLRVLRSGYRRGDLLADLLAGALVGVVALPLAIAFAVASGVSPAAGLVTAVVAGTLISALGGSRFQIGGPTGAFVGLCALVVQQHGTAGLALAGVMAGGLLVLLGALRLGSIIKFIPMPVVIGFTSGIAVIIASTQLRDALGLRSWPQESPPHFHERIATVLANLSGWQPWALLCCLLTLGLTLVLRRWRPRWPGALLAVAGVTVLSGLAGWPVERIGDRFGDIPDRLPLPSLAFLGELGIRDMASFLSALQSLSSPALAIGLLAAIESLLSATVADNMGRDRHDSDSELIGQGIANLVVPFFGGIPATGAIARTATNIRAGARSPMAGIVHALTLLGILLAAGPLVSRIPLACLAGVLMVVAWYMAELKHWPHILRAGRSDAWLLPLSFLLTVLVDLTVAVEVGVVLGMFFFVRRMSETTRIEVWRGEDTPLDTLPGHAVPEGVHVYEVMGPFFFGITAHIRNLIDGLEERHHTVILRMRYVSFVDATAAMALREIVRDCHREGRRILLSGVTARCRADLRRHGLVELIGDANIHDHIQGAVAHASADPVPAGLI